jgi:DNA-binding IclR family transcriptional regulator
VPARHHRTVDRVTQILELVSSRPEGMTLTELTRALDAPKSSILGFVNGLVATGYVEEIERRYTLGPGPYVLTLRANRGPAGTVTHGDLVALAEESGCSVLFGVRVGESVVYVDHIGDSARLLYVAQSRRRRPLLETAAGKVLLAEMDDESLYRYLDDHPRRDLVDDYLHNLANIRATGIAINPRSPESATGAIGCRVRDRHGRVIGAVVLAAIDDVAAHEEPLIKLLIDTTERWASRDTFV